MKRQSIECKNMLAKLTSDTERMSRIRKIRNLSKLKLDIGHSELLKYCWMHRGALGIAAGIEEKVL